MKESDVREMLPIGSVVTLQEGTKRVMIAGRFHRNMMDDEAYDYTAVLYPEGMLDASELYMFNREDIGHVYFTGYECEEEQLFKEYALEQLKKLDMLNQEPAEVQDQNVMKH